MLIDLILFPKMTLSTHTQDWISAIVLTGSLLVYFDYLPPFFRQFRLDDASLQHPFAVEERVSDTMLYVVSFALPLALIVAAQAVRRRYQKKTALTSVALLGLVLAIAATGIVTDILKVWIANPRPDFLARCGAAADAHPAQYVSVDVCTAPLGEQRLSDGMKLTPLGHLLVAFASMYYVFLWLGREGRFPGPAWLTLGVRTAPLGLAAYIALSRTMDYRHHFKDICIGLALGVAGAWTMYRKYH